MGDYHTWLTIPQKNAEPGEAQRDITIEGEILSEIAYLIPGGWCALASFAVFYGIKQIYPEPEGEWVTGDRLIRTVPVGWKMPESKVKLTVKGCNLDTANPHTVYLWLLTKPEEEARPWKIMSDFVAILKKLMGL